MKPDPHEEPREQQADEALAEYMLRLDRGEQVDRDEFLRQHPAVAEELRAYFVSSEAVRQLMHVTDGPSNANAPHRMAPLIDSSVAGSGAKSTELSDTVDSNRGADDPRKPGLPTLCKVPGYEIVREIGRGGMGVVYEAMQKGKDRRVALKVIAHGSQAPPGAAELFLRETSVLSQLRHKRIVAFHEMGMAAGRIFLAMEYVEAIDVRTYLASQPADVQLACYCGIICQVLEALRYTHDQGLVHRDIKPQNILVSRHARKLRTKLADFGLAKHFATAGFSDMTVDGETRGTLMFMAPEQFANSRYAKPSCDLYAAAATLYYYLAGEYPYQFGASRSVYEVSRIVREKPPVPLRERRSDVPEELAQIIEKGLAKDAASRFVSAAQMYAALYPFAKRAGA